MRVCLVTTAFPRWLDDNRGTFVWEAARAVQATGVSVRIIAMHSPGARTHEFFGGVEVIRPRYLWPERLEVLQNSMGGLPIAWKHNPFSRLAIWPFLFAHTLAVMRYARECDVIHANWSLSAAAAWISWRVHGRPILATVQGSDIFQATRVPLARPVIQASLRSCVRVLALSRSLADATGKLGVPPTRIEVLPNGVDIDRFRPSDGRDPVVLFVGSLIERKGVRYLLQAMPAIHKVLPEQRLIIIGDGPQQSELQALTSQLGLTEVVQFLGGQPPDVVSRWLARAKLLVLPSIEEGLGVVLLEALASGTPCLGTSVGGIPDVVTEEVGTLIPPADTGALARAALHLLGDPGRWQALSRAARRRAEVHYSWRRIVERLLTLYHWAATQVGPNRTPAPAVDQSV